jgi:hypothetical protein
MPVSWASPGREVGAPGLVWPNLASEEGKPFLPRTGANGERVSQSHGVQPAASTAGGATY